MKRLKKLIAIMVSAVVLVASSAVLVSAQNSQAYTNTENEGFPSGNVYNSFEVDGCTYDSNFYISSSGYFFYGIGGNEQMDGITVYIKVYYTNSWGENFSSIIKTVSKTWISSLNFDDYLSNYSITPPSGYSISKIEAQAKIVKNGHTVIGSSFME